MSNKYIAIALLPFIFQGAIYAEGANQQILLVNSTSNPCSIKMNYSYINYTNGAYVDVNASSFGGFGESILNPQKSYELFLSEGRPYILNGLNSGLVSGFYKLFSDEHSLIIFPSGPGQVQTLQYSKKNKLMMGSKTYINLDSSGRLYLHGDSYNGYSLSLNP